VNTLQIKQIKALQSSSERYSQQKFLVEGKHLVDEAKKAGLIEEIITCKYPYENSIEVSENVFKSLSIYKEETGVLAVCLMPELTDEVADKVLILDNIQDPGNIGTLLRSAYAFYFNTVFLSEDSCDIYNPKVIQASQGAIFHLNVFRLPRQEIVKLIPEHKLYVTTLQKAIDYKTAPKTNKIALVLGNEGQGVTDFFLKKSDVFIKIIHNPNLDSLNVSSAGSILLNYFSEK
jgi:TrmH family RNA methyltransferase